MRKLILLIVLLCSKQSFAQQIPLFIFDQNFEKQEITAEYTSIFEDKTAELTFEKIIKEKFIFDAKQKLYFGYTPAAYWSKTLLVNQSPDSIIFLEIGYHFYDNIDIYLTDQRGTLINYIQSGDKFGFKDKPIPSRNFTFPLPLSPNDTIQMYVRIASTSSMGMPLKFYTPSAYLKAERQSQIVLGLYYGILLIMIFYNSFLYFSLRDKVYFYYVLFIISLTLFQMVYNGLAFEYIWPSMPLINDFHMPFAVAILNASAFLFTHSFLDVKNNLTKFSKVLKWGALFHFLTGIVSFFTSYYFIMQFVIIAGLLSIITIFYVAIRIYKNGYKASRLFLLGWTTFLLGMFLHVLRSLGVLPDIFITSYGSQFGSAVEIMILSLALADRINILRNQILMNERDTQAMKVRQEKEKNELIAKQKEDLERLVMERTAEIFNQKEEIEAQKNHIEEVNKSIEIAFEAQSRSNKKITDSIKYAKRIQQSIIAKQYILDKYFSNLFIHFSPRDIVSGDFYWSSKVGNKVVLVLADCTGHGVPGAFMSLIGASLLTLIVNYEKNTDPSKILIKMHEYLLRTFGKNHDNVQDGMDVSVLVYDTNEKQIVISSAKQDVFIIDQKNQVIETIKASKYPIGSTHYKTAHQYENHIIAPSNVRKQIILASDGYYDQFGGGQENKKFSKRAFKAMIEKIAFLPANEQKQIIADTFTDWQGNYPQIDDVSVIGLIV